MTAGTTISENK